MPLLELFDVSTRLKTAVTAPEPDGKTTTPWWTLSPTNVSETARLLEALGVNRMASLAKLRMTQFRTVKDAPVLNWIPLLPVPTPSISKPFRLMLSLGLALLVTPSLLGTDSPAK